MIHRTKDTFDSIKRLAEILQVNRGDDNLPGLFFRTINADLEKTDSLIDNLAHYVRVSTPKVKANTVHTLIEKVLKRYQPAFEAKRTKLIKRFERGLPETTVPDDRLDSILDSLLRYALGCLPFNGTFGILTRRSGPRQEDRKGASVNEDTSIEVLLVFTDYSKPSERSQRALGIPAYRRHEPTDLALLLTQETLFRSRGRMIFKTDEKKTRTMITLRLPLERRKIIYYSPAKQ